MRRFMTVVGASVLGSICTIGCQNSGTAQTASSTERPVVAYQPVDTTTYSYPYTTARSDVPWMRLSTDTAPAGMLTQGETVYLRGAAPSTGVVAARTTDGRIIYVRAADLVAR